MATRTRQYESFGSYILFKKLDEDHLGETWRAGRVGGGTISTVALHRLTGGNQEALQAAANFAKVNVALIGGTSIVRNQVIDVIQGRPIIAHDYNGGRSLRQIVAKATNTAAPNPIAPDQALAIAEKVTAAVELIHNVRRDGARVVHGAILPPFIWIEEEGEIRTAGQQLGKGIIASLSSPAVAREIGPYIAPEVRNFGEPSAAGDIYSIGAILFFALTGAEPPDPMHGNFADVLARATLMDEEPIPNEIRAILQKSFAPDINARYSTATDLRRELNALLHSGAYAPTTFNLAFYLSNLLKKEFEAEAAERANEAKVSPAAYAGAATAPTPMAVPSAGRSGAFPVLTTPRNRNRMPLFAAAGVALLALSAFGGYYVLTRDAEPAQAATRVAPAAPSKTTPPPAPPQVVAAVPAAESSTAPTSTALDVEERQRRIDEEVQRRVQMEMMKLQAEYDRELQRERERTLAQTRTTTPSTAAPERREREIARQPARSETFRSTPAEEPTRIATLQPAQTTTTTTTTAPPDVAPPPVTSTQPAPQVPVQTPPSTQPAPQGQPRVLEGDLVGFDQLDAKPQPRAPIRPSYPPVAARQKLVASVFLTALISETGEVLEVKVLRGDARRVGFDEAAVRAVRNTTFTPAMKDGKRVRTWMPIPIRFEP